MLTMWNSEDAPTVHGIYSVCQQYLLTKGTVNKGGVCQQFMLTKDCAIWTILLPRYKAFPAQQMIKIPSTELSEPICGTNYFFEARFEGW